MIGSELLIPVAGVAGSAKSIHCNSGNLERGVSPIRYSADGAQDLADSVGCPRPGLGDHQSAVGSKETIDREEAQRWRAVDDNDLVLDSFERDCEPIIGSDRVG